MPIVNMPSLGENLLYGAQAAGQALKNKELQQQLKVNPDQLLADLAYKRAQTPYIQSQTDLNRATIPLLPEKFMAQNLLGQARIAQAKTSAANSFRNFSETAKGQKILSENPQLADQIQQQMYQEAILASGNDFNGAPLGGITGITRPAPSKNGNSSQISGGITGAPSFQQLPLSDQQIKKLDSYLPKSSNNQMTKDVQQVAADQATLKTTNPAILRQRFYDESVQKMLKDTAPVMPIISKFAGLAGKANQSISKYAQSAGLENDPDYMAYKTFADTQSKIIANDMRRSLGGQATDQEQKMMDNIANPISWDKNPKQALRDYNYLVQTLNDNAEALAESPSENATSIKETIANPTIAGNQNNSKSSDMVRIKTPDGRIGNVPKGSLDQALKLGATQVQ